MRGYPKLMELAYVVHYGWTFKLLMRDQHSTEQRNGNGWFKSTHVS